MIPSLKERIYFNLEHNQVKIVGAAVLLVAAIIAAFVSSLFSLLGIVLATVFGLYAIYRMIKYDVEIIEAEEPVEEIEVEEEYSEYVSYVVDEKSFGELLKEGSVKPDEQLLREKGEFPKIEEKDVEVEINFKEELFSEQSSLEALVLTCMGKYKAKRSCILVALDQLRAKEKQIHLRIAKIYQEKVAQNGKEATKRARAIKNEFLGPILAEIPVMENSIDWERGNIVIVRETTDDIGYREGGKAFLLAPWQNEGEFFDLDLRDSDVFVLGPKAQLKPYEAHMKEKDISCHFIEDLSQEEKAHFHVPAAFNPGATFEKVEKKRATRKPIEPPYNALRCSEEDKGKICKIITSLAEDGVISLGLHRKEMKRTGKEIEDIHPFKFLDYILSNPKLKLNFAKIFTRFGMVRDGFLHGDDAEGGIVEKLIRENKKGSLLRYYKDFAKEIKVEPEPIKVFIDGRNWEQMLKTLAT